MKTALSIPFGALLMLVACTSNETPSTIAEEAVVTKTPTTQQRVDHGRQLVGIMGCNDCHSPKIMGAHGPEPDPERLLSGFPAGTQLPPVDPKATAGWALFSMDLTAAVGPWGTSFAANLTSDGTGIGNWTEEQFLRALRKGLYKGLEGSRPLLPPMPWQNCAGLSDEDIKDIFAYLKSTKPVNNVVPNPLPPPAAQ